VFLWIIPARIDGNWTWTTADGQRRTAVLRQEYQMLSGRVEAGRANFRLRNARVKGYEVSFELTRGGTPDAPVVERYRGRVEGRTITGTGEAGGRRWQWRARHE
jgi:hypothetical protein